MMNPTSPSTWFILILVLGLLINVAQSTRPLFEPLSGIIDDCCCTVQTVDHSLYDEHMHSLLSQLVSSTYFRYFKVNYLKECTLWGEHSVCSIDGPGECGICECDENEIPQAWNVKPTSKDTIVNWKEKDEDVWIIQDDTEDTLYVNLLTNPERYTGYGGGTSVNIWQMIYKENCFPDPYECTEERVFYRLISGLHASTTAHPDNTWAPNLDMFIYRLGAFPDRLKNIYFTFVYLLRAAQKASNFLSNYDYYAANPEEDKRVQALVKSLLGLPLVCSSTFDETTLFQGERAVMKREFMAKFRNISQIMDCVSCQTCKVHAKLQILGIATATKILIADDPNIIKGLQHNEISSLINTLFKFSESIQIIHNMKGREDKFLKTTHEKPATDTETQQTQQTQQTQTQQTQQTQQSNEQPAQQIYQHTPLYALISVVVIITIAILYSKTKILNQTQDKQPTINKTNGKNEKKKQANEPASTSRKSTDKIKNNSSTKGKREQKQS